jgi:Mn2+/Fe2+ NRAMP family transporter
MTVTDLHEKLVITGAQKATDEEHGADAEKLRSRGVPFWRKVLAACGPGLMVCLADTDGGGLITAAQSGAEWRYKLVGLQLALSPVLFCAQDLTLRIGLTRGMGLAAVLRHDVGPKAAWFVAIPLLLTCLGAVVSEMSMIMDVMQWWGVPCVVTNAVVSTTLLLLALTGSYEIPEKVGLAMGICQVLFFATMYIAGPNFHEVASDLQQFPIGERDFFSLATANIGAVIMPWMLAYQQSSMVQKGLSGTADSGGETMLLQRLDTAFGCVLTQGVMIAMLVSVAATVPDNSKVRHVGDLCGIFTSMLGSEFHAKLVLTFAIIGACMVAAIVVSMCAAWTIEEALGQQGQAAGSLRDVRGTIAKRPAFYSVFIGVLVFAFVGTIAMKDVIVKLNIYIEALNGLLMPPVIFALWHLACHNVPEHAQLGPCTKWSLFLVFFVCSAFCLISILS